ncbi:hypothetical protein HDR69_05815 [bacterium]|nr:hypothetical protein [bacterium]
MNPKFKKILEKTAMQARVVWQGHILNPLWHSREERRARRQRVTLEATMKYLHRYDSFIRSIKPSAPRPSEEPERIFTLWLQGEEKAPGLVKACIRSMRRHFRQEVVVLDENSLTDWITLPDYIMEKHRAGKIGAAHFSDICRVELLYRHGGYWLDSTAYVTSDFPAEISGADFFMYLGGEKLIGSYAGVQNCFIRSRREDPLLGIWRAAIFHYWMEEDSVADYFVHQLLFTLSTEQNEEAARLFGKMPHIVQDPTHALWFDHMYDPYDPERFAELTAGTFFQKTTYKSKGLNNVPPGTMADHMLRQ